MHVDNHFLPFGDGKMWLIVSLLNDPLILEVPGDFFGKSHPVVTWISIKVT